MNNSMAGIGKNTASAPLHRVKVENAKTAEVKGKEEAKESKTPSDSVSISAKDQQEPPKKAGVMVYPQDPYMDKPVKEEMDADKTGKDLKGPRAIISDRNNPRAIADVDGNFFYESTQPEFDQVNSFVTVYKTLDMHQTNAGHKIDWAFGSDKISILPHAGEGANAYYARWQGSVNFLYFESEGLDKTVQTAQSADVVSHEVGHATLDGMRPGYLSSWGGETRAFHEAFADSTAMLYNLSKDSNVEGIIKETGGDLKKWNRLSMLAEEFGAAIRKMDDDPSNDHKTYLRNAINSFKYVPPSQLPSEGPREELTSESHSFSRVFSGAFYDLIDSVYQKNLKEMPPLPQNPDSQEPPKPDMEGALKAAGKTLGPILAKAVDLTPRSDGNYKTVALCMLKADKMLNEGANRKELADTFLARNILKPEDLGQAGIMSNIPDVTLEKKPTSKKEGLEFLNKNAAKLGIDAKEFVDVENITDNKGNTFLQYTSNREVPVNLDTIYKMAGENQVYVDVQGGLTLAFNPEGNLVSKMADDITAEKISETIKGLRAAQQKGLVRRTPIFKGDNLFKSNKVPYEAEVFQEASGKFKVARVPVIVD